MWLTIAPQVGKVILVASQLRVKDGGMVAGGSATSAQFAIC
jgi:hypothetical protein